jgi:SAM-dependent methyltransferase
MDEEKNRDAVEASYAAQSGFYEELYHDRAEAVSDGRFFRDDTPKAWVHRRLLQCADPLLECDPQARWLTVGDGRFGRDAHYIESKGLRVLATDISDSLLKQAKEQGYISECRALNAEAMALEDNSHDFVLCKESYHHFPRPAIALYEMMRVASQGVILIEPNDEPTVAPLLFVAKRLFKSIAMRLGLGQLLRTQDTSIIQPNTHFFEKSGNYMYGLSARELEKVAIGLNCAVIALKGMDICEEALEEEGITIEALQRRSEHIEQVVKRSLSQNRHGYLAAIILKFDPEEALRAALEAQGYNIIDLPRNPHLA